MVLLIGSFGYGWVQTTGGRAPLAAVVVPPARTPAVQTRLDHDAATAVARLARMYHPRSNYDTRSWRAANTLSAIIGYMQVSGSRKYLSYLSKTYLAHLRDRFVNRHGYYDDEAWWALTWMHAYDLTGDVRYLRLTEFLFRHLTAGWTPECGGGLLWNRRWAYKDAITNELFLEVAAGLHNRTPGDTGYADWALREWQWFQGTGMLTGSHLVVDGLLANCRPWLRSPPWTYNQGALIGALLELERMTRQPSLLVTARAVANAVIRSPLLSPDGILHDPCGAGTGCDSNTPTFKGVFAANLHLLYDEVGGHVYERYLLRNAITVWVRDRRGSAFGMNWAGPFDRSDPARQLAAAMLLSTQVRPTRGASRPPLTSPRRVRPG